MPASNRNAGMSLTKSGTDNPNPIQHGGIGQAERAFSAASTFLSGVMAISASQFIGAPLKLVDPKFYDGYMAWTKESFAVLVTTMTQWWAPTVVRVSGDESMKGQLYQMEDGTLKCNFPHRLVLMANHQLYTDWLYLWWIAYTNKMHGRIYIILKESLKSIPIFGWGAQFYNFIFLSRKWETDKFRFRNALNHLKDPHDPMWLLIFPEGTNLSQVTRDKSAAWAKKTGVQDMKNQLLPRQTGLQFCLQELRSTTNWLYDCTIAYEGVPKGMYGQDIFTLRSSFFEGRPPKSVNMYWRRFKIADIPLDNDVAFGRWLTNRWREKDYILEYFNKYSHFPDGNAMQALQAAEGKRKPSHARFIASEVKGGGWDEFLGIFGPITTAAGALQAMDLTEPLDFDNLMAKVAQQQTMSMLGLGKGLPMPATSQEAIRNALNAAQKQKALPKPMIDRLTKNPPTSPEEMVRLLMTTSPPQTARKVAKAASVDGASMAPMNTSQQKARQQALRDNGSPKANSIPNPGPSVKKAMPLANMESMVTRPLSTMAMQTAAGQVRNVAAQRTKATGSPLPGQDAAAAKSTAKPAAKRPTQSAPASRAPSVIGVPPSKPPTGKQAAASGGGSAKPATKAKQASAGSRPVGTQKYAEGKKV
ncbi:hypothetical protein MBLNU230_g0891t1 [Neophaeotheca triangularis]